MSVLLTKPQATAHAARIAHASVGRQRRRRVPRALPPTAIKRAYSEQLRSVVREAFAPAAADIAEAISRMVAEEKGSRSDAVALHELVAQARATALAHMPTARLEAAARNIGRQSLAHTGRELARQARAALGADIVMREPKKAAGRIDRFVADNVSLMRALADTTFANVDRKLRRALAKRLDAVTPRSSSPRDVVSSSSSPFITPRTARQSLRAEPNARLIVNRPSDFDARRLASAVTRNVAEGGSVQQMTETLIDEFGFAENHADLIARDQVGKLVGQLNADRQQDLGIDRFVWRTVGDERVRDEHDELDGETFSYDDPPSEGLPGEPVSCRCSAEPVFDDIVGQLEE